MKDKSDVLVAFMAGAALGAFFGVLFAPHKGTKTRRIIREQGQNVASQFREIIDEGVEKISSLKDDIVEIVNEAAEGYTKQS